MHEEAKSIVQKLNEEGYLAYFAGGWVRDFLLGVPSDDIDIATNALPETIQTIFPKTVPIGLSFGIILVIIGDKKYEVATFRSDFSYKDGRRPSRIEYTNPMEDAKRRDFTINGIFFDPMKEELIDYVGGKEDLEKKIIRAIGNPHQRFQEDRLRMMRAVRLSARLSFTIEKETEKAICSHAKELLPAVAMERIWQEFTKITAYPNKKKAFSLLHRFGLLSVIFSLLQETTEERLEKRIRFIDDYPSSTPTVAFVFSLFPPLSLEEKVTIAERCKLSKKEISFLIFWHQAEDLLSKPLERENSDWVPFYASPFAETILFIHAAHLPTDQRTLFFTEHQKREEKLSFFIESYKNRQPILTAQDLIQEGITPSPLLGDLLREGEKIAANAEIKEKEKLLERIKQSSLWPKE